MRDNAKSGALTEVTFYILLSLYTHDAFCKTVIRHAAIDAARSIRSRRKREISLEYYFFITHKQKALA